MSTAIGRSVVGYKVNKSGGGVIKGDVVVPDTTNDNAFTTTTSAAATTGVWVADETIASNATGRVVLEGHVTLINVSASVTRGHTGTTHTVAKQAVSTGGTTRTAGTFCKFTTGGTTPEADIWPVDLLGTSLSNPMTTTGDIIQSSDNSGTPARLAAAASGKLLTAAGTGTVSAWGQGPLTTTGDLMIGATGGTPTRLASGASGLVLTSGGASAVPSWAAGGITQTTLGTTSAGGSFRSPTGTTYLKKVTVATACFVPSLMVYVKGDGTNEATLGAGIFSDTAGAPVLVSAGVTQNYDNLQGQIIFGYRLNTTARWIALPLGAWLTAADYWLAVVVGASVAGGAQIAYASGTGSDKTQAIMRLGDVSIAATSTTTDDHSIYANILR